ncbi:SpoIIE family protein phosphatase [Gracilibacillus dipsosauri]|uniref:Indirect negative regulator of sigma-B activity n=1 Tax=Gracilibacillus dipsosauri TaxID=178340 RepID=A0A317KY75_9BACI|nr:SpoIIE family protein phosphatase [Gracilibacillus dipsosauri]PWU68074.1 indirect negative regulator of sigma-B activity [Gracilibacillus dipsosauri]
MQKSQQVEVSVFQKAKDDNYYCGDSYFYKEVDGTFICALADGLGSGKYANESSQLVVDIIREYSTLPLKLIMKKCNESLFGKRGVVLGILQIDLETQEYAYTSIGNIGLMTITADSIKKRTIPQAGYLSGYERPVKIVKDRVEDGMIFVMFSDGVTSKEISNSYFLHKEVNHITDTFAYLYQNKLNDDTTLIAMKFVAGTS